MAAGQAEDVRASFLFVGNLNGHHQECMGSMTTNSHWVAAFDFATVSGCDQLVVGQTHARGATLDLLMTDVLDQVWVAVVAPIGKADHFSRSEVISMAQAVPNLCVRRKVFLKHQVNYNTVWGATRDLPRRNIWHADNPTRVFLSDNPTKVIRVLNNDRPWLDDQFQHAFGLKQESDLRWTHDRSWVNWEEFVAVKWELIKPTRRPRVSLVPKTGMFLWMGSLLISGGPLLSPPGSARVRHCHPCWWRWWTAWCASRLAKLICSRIILMASIPGSLLICRSLAIRLWDLPPLPL